MGILNYTTKIDSGKSAAEIQNLLGMKGAQSVSMQFANQEPVAVFFSIEVNDTPINFRLPCNWEGVLNAMKRDKKMPFKNKTIDQAKRTAWRIIKDWVEAQLALIEAGQADMAEVFMPYMINSSGKTIFKMLEENPRLLIGN